MSSSRVVRVHARDEVARAVPARRDREDPVRAQGHAGLRARGRGGRRRARRRPRGCPTSTAPTCRSSPSTRRRRWTSTRRSTSSARATVTSCTTRSPTSQRSSRRATRSTSPPTSAARRCTARTPRSRCTRRRSPRAPPRCCPTRCGPPCSGRSTSTTPARAPTSTSSGRGCGRRPSSTTRACSRRSTTAAADEVLQLLKEVGELRLAARGRTWRHLAPAARAGGRHRRGDDWSLEFRSMIPAETWNAQISMLTGFAAASLMVYARVGLLRTLPPPQTARPPAAAPRRPGAPPRLAGRAALPGLHPRPRLPQARRGGDDHRVAPGCCAGAGTSPSTVRCRPTRSTPRWRPSTPTSPRRCAGSAIGTPGRSASPCAPAPTCRAGCWPGSPGSPT